MPKLPDKTTITCTKIWFCKLLPNCTFINTLLQKRKTYLVLPFHCKCKKQGLPVLAYSESELDYAIGIAIVFVAEKCEC